MECRPGLVRGISRIHVRSLTSSAILFGDTSNTVRRESVAFAGVINGKVLDPHSGAALFEFQQISTILIKNCRGFPQWL
jgi:hypothetical protein